MDVLTTLKKLPAMCASINPSTGKPIIIKRGESGYYPCSALGDEAGVDGFNRRHNVTPAQREAMEIGSMFGWEVPGADPDTY